MYVPTVTETDNTGEVTEEILWGHQLLARKIDSSWYYYIYNAHGDVVGLVNDAGTVVNTYEYTPWGEIHSETEAVDNPIKYAGEYYDDELDMIYLRARYYNPKIGRFTSLDIEEGEIASPLDMNRYVYCRNNPIKYVDPSGEAVAISAGGVVIISIITILGTVVTSAFLQKSQNNQRGLEGGMSKNQKEMFQREIEDYKRGMGRGPGDHLPWEILVEIAEEIKKLYK